MTSLAELRSIEEQRLLAERAARQAEEDARVRAKAAAEQAARDAETARIAEERAAALAIEEARHAAEREARMRVEATEAAERARHQAALDEARLAQEMEIAREIAKRTKPKWMVAVTIGAVLATGALAVFAVGRMRQSDEAERIAQQARADAAQSKLDKEELGRQVAILDEQTRENTTRLNKAIDDLTHAEGEAALAESRRRIEAERKQQIELARQRQILEEIRIKKERNTPVDMNKCLAGGSLGGKGCMK